MAPTGSSDSAHTGPAVHSEHADPAGLRSECPDRARARQPALHASSCCSVIHAKQCLCAGIAIFSCYRCYLLNVNSNFFSPMPFSPL